MKYEAEKYQKLLTDSQEHYDELDQRYKTAKKKIKDYQERFGGFYFRENSRFTEFSANFRERDLLEREEIHLQQLREKDAQYAALVKQLNDKVHDFVLSVCSKREIFSFVTVFNGFSNFWTIFRLSSWRNN